LKKNRSIIVMILGTIFLLGMVPSMVVTVPLNPGDSALVNCSNQVQVTKLANQVNVICPTNTATRTATPIKTSTVTKTSTSTVVPSKTPTATNTQTATGTSTVTSTPTVIVSTNTAAPTGTSLTYMPFLETFDGAPAMPLAWRPANWDVTVHSRNLADQDTLPAVNADHGTLCEAPPAIHPVSTYQDAVFLCNNHLMTAINGTDYGLVYLTPNQQVDFSNGTAVIKFDVSTLRRSKRDWLDMWITPFDQNLQLPLDNWLPDLNGEPQNSIHVRMDTFNGDQSFFRVEDIQNFAVTRLDGNWWTGYEQFLTPSASIRTTFEVDISQTHIRVGMPAYNFWWVDSDIPALGFTQGVVQFGHHSYNPSKDCNFDGTCGPNTWHWDNASISPSIPFTIDRGSPIYANDANPVINLSAPSPSNGFLRFAGIGSALSVSYDGGVTWTPAVQQTVSESIEEHFKSYWMPIPAGTTQIKFSGQAFWGGDWIVRDVSVWAK